VAREGACGNVLVDTDVIISFLRNYPPAVEFVREASRSGRIRVSLATVCELFEGATMSADKNKVLEVESFVSSCEVITPSVKTARVFGQIAANILKRGEGIPEFDLLIASSAIEFNEQLATRNTRHFNRIAGLKLCATW